MSKKEQLAKMSLFGLDKLKDLVMYRREGKVLVGGGKVELVKEVLGWLEWQDEGEDLKSYTGRMVIRGRYPSIVRVFNRDGLYWGRFGFGRMLPVISFVLIERFFDGRKSREVVTGFVEQLDRLLTVETVESPFAMEEVRRVTRFFNEIVEGLNRGNSVLILLDEESVNHPLWRLVG